MSTADDAAAGRAAQRWAWALVLVGALGFVLVAWLRVPWHWLPDGRQITPVSASEAFTHRQLVRADSYSSAQRTLSLTSYGVSLLVTFGLGFTPLGARLLGRLRGWWWVRVTLGCFLLLLLGELVTLPLALMIRRNALRAGLTNQDLAGWLRDDLVGLMVSTAFTAIGALVLIGLARRLPRTWPLYAGVLSALLVVLGSFVYPLVVEPLFNRFTSLPAGPLRTSILRLAAVEHVRVDDVLVADASRRTTSLNAYVTGFGSTRRVVLYDNTVNDLQRAEIESVVAHELGHARHDDVLLGTVLGACGAALGVGLLALIVAQPGVRRRSGITGMADPRSVALLLALTAAGVVPGQPGGEHDQPRDRGARRPERTRRNPRPGRVRRAPEAAGDLLAAGAGAPGVGPALVRQPPDPGAADRHGPHAGEGVRRGRPVTRTLVVTNDFPTRRGGIETFVLSLCQQLPADEVVVYTAAMPGGTVVRRDAGVSGAPRPDLHAAADAARRGPRRARPARDRVRPRAVRRIGAAGSARGPAARRRRRAGRGAHPRPRGVVGAGAGGATGAPPDR